MIWINPGDFTMGSGDGEVGRGTDEALHQVHLTHGFWMGKYPVTQEQWEALMDGGNPSHFKDREDSDTRPVERVTWNDCQNFIERLNTDQKYTQLLPEGYQYRLPTEAEWEYACRAGTQSPFNGPCGEPLSTLTWCRGNTSGRTQPVGQKTPNSWGLHDMHGHVWEWCQDWYGTYGRGPATNPTGPVKGRKRVLRGGSWLSEASNCRSAMRRGACPHLAFQNIGFRLVAAPKSP